MFPFAAHRLISPPSVQFCAILQPEAEKGARFRLQATDQAISWVSAPSISGRKRASFRRFMQSWSGPSRVAIRIEEAIYRPKSGRACAKQPIRIAAIDTAERNDRHRGARGKAAKPLNTQIVSPRMTCRSEDRGQKNRMRADRLGVFYLGKTMTGGGNEKTVRVEITGHVARGQVHAVSADASRETYVARHIEQYTARSAKTGQTSPLACAHWRLILPEDNGRPLGQQTDNGFNPVGNAIIREERKMKRAGRRCRAFES
jgi:hypothetical protein